MEMIVLNTENKDRLLNLRNQFLSDINEAKSDLNPVQILSGEFILPLSVLQDSAFAGMKQKIIDDGNEGLITIREVLESEFIRENIFE